MISIKKMVVCANGFFMLASISCHTWSLPFDIQRKINTVLPSVVYPGSPVTAYYTVRNMTSSARLNNTVKYLPPNVVQVTENGTFTDTCGSIFNLAAKDSAGDSCTLQLSISGAVNGSDPQKSHHLFVCFPGGQACAGTNDSLNVEAAQYSNNYGQLISSSSAPPLTSTYIQSTVTSNIACPSSLNGSYPGLCTDNKYYLNNDTVFGLSPLGLTIDNFVTSSPVTSQTPVTLLYTSPGLHSSGSVIPTVISSGLVLIPNLSVSAIKGVVLYYHPTVSAKCGVPSGINNGTISACTTDTQETQEKLAATYGAAGYIVIAPDYLGQGANSDVVHSHNLFAQQQSVNGIYFLPAVNTYLKSQGINLAEINGGNPVLAIAGFSEGGNYALWASYLLQEDYASILTSTGLQLGHTFGMEGLYDYSGVMLNFFFDNVYNGVLSSGEPDPRNTYNLSPGCVPGLGASSDTVCGSSGFLTEAEALSLAQVQIAEKKVYFAFDINTYGVYSATTAPLTAYMGSAFVNQVSCIYPSDITTVVSPATYEYVPCSEVLAYYGGSGSYTLSELFYNNGLDSGQINSQITGASVGSSNQQQFVVGGLPNYTAVLAASGNGQTFNSVASYVYPQILQDSLFLNQAQAIDSYLGKTNTPVTLIYLRYDTIVSNLNAAAACNPSGPSLYTNSSPGLVTCLQDPGIPSDPTSYPATNGINNTNLWDLSTGFPLYLYHGDFEGIAQMASVAILNG